MTLILASGSPRRRALLAEAGIECRVTPVSVSEDLPHGVSAREATLLLARRKARAAARGLTTGRVLGADTLISLDGAILGKPGRPEDVRRMLARLSGRVHEAWTGICLLDAGTGEERELAVATRVTFRRLGEAEIEAYAASGEGLDKAGGYGIQGTAGTFVTNLEGPRDNVIGLPVEAVRELLR